MALWCVGCCQPPQLPTQPARLEPDPYGPIIVVGDTQRTSCLESLGREQNEDARQQLVEAIVHGPRPAFLVHLGDMVAQGDSAAEWAYFRALFSPLHRVATYPVLGNHDLWGEDDHALQLATAEYPVLSTRFYARRFRGLGLVWLDSNLDGYRARAQSRWLHETLQAFDADPVTRAVLVFTHHPAFTNGIARRGEPYVLDHVLPEFRRSAKTLALFSGHVHGYERFERDGKNYVVTGGGGGPRVEYRIAPDTAYLHRTSEPSPFHYLTLHVEREGIELSVRCVAAAAEGCHRGLLEPPVSLPWPRAAGAESRADARRFQ